MTQKIIIDTDPGIDDAMAILMAFADSRLDVVGLTSVFGNVTTKQATRNALHLCEIANHPGPVAEGASIPLRRSPAPPADFVHGAQGFGHLDAPSPTASAIAPGAADFLCQSCAANPGEIVICAVGPLTNLAAALETDPEITSNAAHVVVMGGSAYRDGNVSKWAEANIWNDPHAADAVFRADWDVTMVGLDVTETLTCLPDEMAAIAKESPLAGGFLDDATQFYFDFHASRRGERKCFLHDPAAVLAITDKKMFTFENTPIEVVLEGEQMGRTAPRRKAGRRSVGIATKVDVEAAKSRFLELLCGADAANLARAAAAE